MSYKTIKEGFFMFKKLVVGALATGIALTGGIGAASADTVKPISDRIESIVENTNEVERPFVPNLSDKNNLIGEKAAAAFDWGSRQRNYWSSYSK